MTPPDTIPDAAGREDDRPRLSASRLSLAAACPGSFALTHDDYPNPAAEKGTAIHAFLEGVLAEGLAEPERVRDPEARAVCGRIDPAAVLDVSGARLGGLHVEVPLAYDPATGEAQALPSGGHRDYSAAPEGAVCGTADVVAQWADGDGRGRLLVSDYKTGARAVPAAHENRQLLFLALCAKKAIGRPDDRVAAQIVHVGADGALHPSACEFTGEELDAAEEDLRAVARSVADSRAGSPRFAVGAHCRFCPALARCPAMAGAAQALLAEKDAEISDENVPALWARLQAVESAAKVVRARLTDLVAGGEGPVPLDARRQFKVVESRREKIDPRKAMPLLREAFGEAADDAASVSKTGLRRVAGSDHGRVMADLERAGAVEVTHTESLREVAAGGA